MFLGASTKENLYALIFGEPGELTTNRKTEINRLSNIITLSATVHLYWSDGSFTLDAVLPSNENELNTRFEWLPIRGQPRRERPTIRLDVDPATLEPGDRPGTFFAHPAGHPVQTGQIICFTTNEPGRLPLPSSALLSLQSVLNRVLSLAGGAGDEDEEVYFSSDEESVGVPEEVPWWAPSEEPHPDLIPQAEESCRRVGTQDSNSDASSLVPATQDPPSSDACPTLSTVRDNRGIP
jgi:hypothetical protein